MSELMCLSQSVQTRISPLGTESLAASCSGCPGPAWSGLTGKGEGPRVLPQPHPTRHFPLLTLLCVSLAEKSGRKHSIRQLHFIRFWITSVTGAEQARGGEGKMAGVHGGPAMLQALGRQQRTRQGHPAPSGHTGWSGD